MPTDLVDGVMLVDGDPGDFHWTPMAIFVQLLQPPSNCPGQMVSGLR